MYLKLILEIYREVPRYIFTILSFHKLIFCVEEVVWPMFFFKTVAYWDGYQAFSITGHPADPIRHRSETGYKKRSDYVAKC